jgi:hypothetical protein
MRRKIIMSTCAVIAVPDGDGWRGRYHHHDGYPSGLGAELFALYERTFDRDLSAMTATLIDDHPSGWSSIISIRRYVNPPVFSRAEFTGAGWGNSPELGPSCYCHGGRAEPAHEVICRCADGDEAGCDPSWLVWAYVLTPAGLQIITSRPVSGDRYAHAPLGAPVAWTARRPDWAALTRLGTATTRPSPLQP